MNKKTVFILLGLLAGVCVIALVLAGFKAETATAAPDAPEAWYGSWQMGPTFDTTLIGCPAGNGYARITGVYYPNNNRIYFLGARCEDNNTYGQVFYFDLGTRTYSVTGTNMPVPVSNYQVVTVPNDGAGNGPGFYIVGGRDNAGGQTAAVQVYYPDTNTAATIATDPFPPAVLYSPGGVVYAGGEIYVFGGFDGTNMYNVTYVYDPAAAPGSRWTELTSADLPTGRSYISAVAVGNLIYAAGGDELPALTPIDDTVVLDITNTAAGWQDASMADMPVVNGDAPAAYVGPSEGYLGGAAGGIYVIGGGWPAPGPYRHVLRYDIATDTWDNFPDLAIPDPATGRRNQAAVYVPDLTVEGLGNGQPGIWTFGGYDGSSANAMADDSEYFSVNTSLVLVMPDAVTLNGVPGTGVTHNFHLLNLTANPETFDLSVSSNVTWTVTLPASVGPVAGNGEAPFSMDVQIPAGIACPATGTFDVTATSQVDPLLTDTQTVDVVGTCGLGGVVTDATTGQPIEAAYVAIQNTVEGLDTYLDAFTNADGEYTILNIPPDHYYMYVSALGNQPSFYPDGWPAGAIEFDIAGTAVAIDVELVSSLASLAPSSFDVTVGAGARLDQTLTITNTGTGPLVYNLDIFEGSIPVKSPESLPVPGLPRVDPKLYADLDAAGDAGAEFVVVLKEQADLSAAEGIADWQSRGEYVLNALRGQAQLSQRGLVSALRSAGASYEPLYVINAVIVKDGSRALVDSLAFRSDVAQIVANHRITIEEPVLSDPLGTEAIEWNILRINADDVWSTYGVTGEDIVVAEVDTGTQWDHPALQDHYRGWDGVSADHNYNWFDPYGQSPTEPADASGHGTHVMGTMVGDDGGSNQIGVAPGAQWISCDGGDDVSGYLFTNELLQCAQWILAPTDLQGLNPDPDLRPHVVNNSWGGGPNDYWYTGAVYAWRAAGIFPQFANGNAGPGCETAHSPGDTVEVFAAGASDINNAIAGFSSRGPAQFMGFLKPNITAPGVAIRSSVPGSSYANFNGTSMASPHVAGALALLWSADPELVGQIDLTMWLLQETAKPVLTNDGCGDDIPGVSHPNNTWGYGLLDIKAAVDRAQAGGLTPNWLSADPMGGEILPGETGTVNLTFAPDYTTPAGVYTASLMVAVNEAHPPFIVPVTLTVTVEPPTAGFTSNSPVLIGDTMVFTNTTTGTPVIDYLWDFGDTFTSTLENPTHDYAAVGVYTATLTATNAYGVDTEVQTVEVQALQAPEADFTSNSPLLLGEMAVFNSTVTGTPPFTYAWDFGDGAGTSADPNPTYVYTAVGVYDVTLTVTGPGGTDTVTHPFVVDAIGTKVYLPLVSRE